MGGDTPRVNYYTHDDDLEKAVEALGANDAESLTTQEAILALVTSVVNTLLHAVQSTLLTLIAGENQTINILMTHDIPKKVARITGNGTTTINCAGGVFWAACVCKPGSSSNTIKLYDGDEATGIQMGSTWTDHAEGPLYATPRVLVNDIITIVTATGTCGEYEIGYSDPDA